VKEYAPDHSTRGSSGRSWPPKLYAVVTAVLGMIQVAYNTLWLGRTPAPFDVPPWLVYAELGWAFVSFAALLVWRARPSAALLATSYVVYTGFALLYTLHLGQERGTVTESMVPEWWKVLAVLVGAFWIAGSISILGHRDQTAC